MLWFIDIVWNRCCVNPLHETIDNCTSRRSRAKSGRTYFCYFPTSTNEELKALYDWSRRKARCCLCEIIDRLQPLIPQPSPLKAEHGRSNVQPRTSETALRVSISAGSRQTLGLCERLGERSIFNERLIFFLCINCFSAQVLQTIATFYLR